MLRSAHGPKILEVNSSPGFEGVTSARASTCSSRLQCLIPASAGWIASRVVHAIKASPSCTGGMAWVDTIQVGCDAGGGA